MDGTAASLVVPSLRAPAAGSAPALLPRAGDREGAAGVLDVDEEPLAVGGVGGARPLAAAEDAGLVFLPAVEVERGVVAGEGFELPRRAEDPQVVVSARFVLAVAVLADQHAAARRDRDRVGFVEVLFALRLVEQDQRAGLVAVRGVAPDLALFGIPAFGGDEVDAAAGPVASLDAEELGGALRAAFAPHRRRFGFGLRRGGVVDRHPFAVQLLADGLASDRVVLRAPLNSEHLQHAPLM